MKTKLLIFICSLSILFANMACSEKIVEKEAPANGTPTEAVKLDPNTADAETFVIAGELLFGSDTMDVAINMFERAYAADPSHLRAEFWYKLTSRIRVLQGIANRMRPFVKKYGDRDLYEANIKKMPESSFKKYLLAGPQDIDSEPKLQEVLSLYRDQVLDFYTFLDNNMGQDLVLHVDPQMIGRAEKSSCFLVYDSNGVGSVFCTQPNLEKSREYHLDLTDWYALRSTTAGELAYLLIATSYNASGLATIASFEPEKLTRKFIIEYLRQVENFGELLPNNHLNVVDTMAKDIVYAWDWAIGHYAEVCQRGPDKLFPSHCHESLYDKQKWIEFKEIVNGPGFVMKYPNGKNSPVTNILIDPFGFMRQPSSDLKSLFPISYKSCDVPNEWQDPTLGGLFPDGNVQLLIQDCKK